MTTKIHSLPFKNRSNFTIWNDGRDSSLDIHLSNSAQSPSKLDLFCRIVQCATNILRIIYMVFDWRQMRKDSIPEQKVSNEQFQLHKIDIYGNMVFIKKLYAIRKLHANEIIKEEEGLNRDTEEADTEHKVYQLIVKELKKEDYELAAPDEVAIDDAKLLYSSICDRATSSCKEICQDRGFFSGLDIHEKHDQTVDHKSFEKTYKKLGLFKNKYIRRAENSNFTVKLGKSQKSQGKKILQNLVSKKIERVQSKLFAINFEMKFLRGCDIEFAPKEWWSLQERCIKQPSDLSESQKRSLLRELRKTELHFTHYRITLMDQLSDLSGRV